MSPSDKNLHPDQQTQLGSRTRGGPAHAADVPMPLNAVANCLALLWLHLNTLFLTPFFTAFIKIIQNNRWTLTAALLPVPANTSPLQQGRAEPENPSIIQGHGWWSLQPGFHVPLLRARCQWIWTRPLKHQVSATVKSKIWPSWEYRCELRYKTHVFVYEVGRELSDKVIWDLPRRSDLSSATWQHIRGLVAIVFQSLILTGCKN